MEINDYSPYIDCIFRFVRYYKYTFYFEPVESIAIRYLHVGGVGSDIYRLEIKPEMTLCEILNEVGSDSDLLQVFMQTNQNVSN